MKATEEKSKGLTKKFKAVIAAADFEKEVEKRIEKLAKTTKLPGFRPGKAPKAMLEQKYRSAVLGEALDFVVQDAVSQIVKDNKLRLAFEPSVKLEKFEDGKDITFVMEAEVLPEIKLSDFSSLKLERFVADVSEDEIQKSLEYIASTRRETESVQTKRKSKKGDVVSIDFKGTIGGVEFAGGKGQDYPLELGSNSFIAGFEDQLIGHQKGDKVDVKVQFPKNYHAKDLAGKDAVFAVEIKDLKVYKKPEINDEFAVKLGEKDLAALKQKISQRIGQDHDAASKMKLKRALLDVLDKAYSFDVPSKLVDAEYEGIVKQYEHAKEHNHLDEYEKSKSEKDLLKEYKEIAVRRVKLGLLLSEVGIKEKIGVTSDDLNKAIMAEAKKYLGQEKAVFDYYLKNKNAVEALKAPVMEEKIVDFILSKVQMKDKKVTAEALYSFDEDKKPASKK
ncbi:MAG: trigger factor [Alphaproteobacteria bacterium]|nr:trigger factor [Alphaproteobacteria bacterium]